MGLFSTKCKSCGHSVKRGANFCPMCREPVAGGIVKCGTCGTDLKSDRKFCGKCGAEVAKHRRPTIIDDRWARQEGEFAARIDDQDVKGFLAKPLVIESGTKALLLQRGKIKKELEAGTYNMGGLLQEINYFLVERDSTMMIVDAGNISLDMQNADLWSKDQLEVQAAERVIFRMADAEKFFLNVFKNSRLLTVDEIERELAGEVQMILRGLCAKYTAEQLSVELTIRNELETALRESLAGTLDEIGLELVQLRFIGFECGQYEAIRKETGEVNIAEEKTKLAMRLRETLTQNKMDEIRTEADLENFIRQSEHELGMKDVIRTDEMAKLKQKFGQEMDINEVLHDLEKDSLKQDHAREQEVKTAETKRNVRDIEHEQDMKEARDGIGLANEMADLKHKKELQRVKEEEELLKVRSEATVESLLSILDGPQAERLAELEKLRTKENMTAEQILAITAEVSPEAAKALAEKYKSEGMANEKLIDQLKDQLAAEREMAGDYADRMERIQKVALEQMGDVATMRSRPANVPHTQVSGAKNVNAGVHEASVNVAGKCEHCGTVVDAGDAYCGACGKAV